ncbi:hypothetical protein [Sphingomonas bacterium]|uniref:hypothetical protein n=1 Tax=Sphingomonas bacterium TaxID=1895847 RepID=UPI001575BA87|nr:hypothetical protein [Sphingomonas bacterium]
MRLVRGAIGLAVAGMLAGAAVPASAQFYMKSRDLSGAPVQGDEADIVQPLPGATRAETRAGLVWTMRAALNVAALQCDFQPTLTTVFNYNALLRDHKAELGASWDTLAKYFARVNGKSKLAGQNALDHYQTQTYSSFSTIAAQLTFCQTVSAIGRDALFTPRGQFSGMAEARMREVRNSLTPWGEQIFVRYMFNDRTALPRFDPACWTKKGQWVAKKCGSENWPPAGTGMASQ